MAWIEHDHPDTGALVAHGFDQTDAAMAAQRLKSLIAAAP